MLRDHKIIRIKSLVTQSRVIKNYSSPARSSRDKDKNFESCRDSKFAPRRTKLADGTKLDEQKPNRLRPTKSSFVYEQGSSNVVVDISPLFCRRDGSPVRLHSSGPP